MMELKDLIHNGIYKKGLKYWRYNAGNSSFMLIENFKKSEKFNSISDLLEYSPVTINSNMLVNNGFVPENDETAMDERVVYKLPTHNWFTIEKDGKNRFFASVNGGIILAPVKYAHELQKWFDILNLNKICHE